MKHLTLLLLFLSLNALSQNSNIFHIDSLPTEGVLLVKGWKWHEGDNPDFAKADFDDSAWESIDPTKDIFDLTQISKNGQIGWFRLRLSMDESLLKKQISLVIQQTGASEIYLNGLKIITNGTINTHEIIAKDPLWKPFPINLHDEKQQVIAVKFALQPKILYTAIFENYNPAFWINVMDSEAAVTFHYAVTSKNLIFIFLIIGFSLMIFFIHSSFYLLYPDQKANLYFSLFALYLMLGSLSQYFYWLQPFQVSYKFYLGNLAFFFFIIGYFNLLKSAYLFLDIKKDFFYYLIAIFGIIAVVLNAYPYNIGWKIGGPLLMLSVQINTARIAVKAVRKKLSGSWIITIGAFCTLILFSIFMSQGTFTNTSFLLSLPLERIINYVLYCLSLPVSTSLFLAFQFADISKGLKRKIIENEALSTEKQEILSTQNETLEKQVTERTAELVHKNRDLEIEAALDKVRARSLEMQRSDELKEVVATLYEQLRHLGFQYGAACIFIMDKETNDLVQWVSGFNQSEYPIGYHVKYFNHPVYEAQLRAWKNGDKYVELLLAGEEKKVFDEYMFTQTDFKNFPEQGKAFMQSLQSVVFSLAFLKHGALQWGPEKLNDEQAKILQKFAVVFEQAYTRFLDLQKAEAQAREAQIEVALEKIRSRSLAMHRSDELKEVMVITFEKMKELGVIRDGGIGIHLFTEGVKDNVLWVASPSYINEPSCIKLPYDENILAVDSYVTEMFKAKREGRDVFNKIQPFEEKNRYFDYVFANNDFETIPSPTRDFIHASKSHTFSMAIEKNSSVVVDSWTEQLMTEKEFNVLKRLARVFEQAYIRFLDLKKAEAQAREAQIEIALERVRSKTLAMQSSDELSTIIGLIYQEMSRLNVQLQRCFFMILNPQNFGVTWWMASGESLDLGQGYFVQYSEHPPQLAYLKGWQERQETWRYLMQGEEKTQWDAFLFHETELSSLPSFIIDNMKSFKSIHLEASFNSFGCLTTGNEQPLNQEAFDLLIRFSKVFDLTYTRFNDITIAEAQTKEARIQIALERIRAKALAMESSTEINTVIATIYRECNTLFMDIIASLIIIYDEVTLDTDWYIAKQEDPDFSSGFRIPQNKHNFSLAMLEGWQQKSNDWAYFINPVEKAAWDDYIFSETDFGLLPDIVRNAMRSAPTLYTRAAFGDFGCVMLSSLQASDDEQKILLTRITNVFDFAYTRFKDLQQREILAKQAEEDLIKLKEEKRKTDQAITELKSTQNQLIQKEKLASLGELTAGIAHEIQNPLNFVNNFSELSVDLVKDLKDEIEKPAQDKAYIGELFDDLSQNQEKINHHGKRASSIVKGMLEHSRASTGVKELTDINKLADEYLRLAYHGLRAKDKDFNANFKTDFEGDLPKIEVIPQDIGRVLLNLINNAFYAVAPPISEGELSNRTLKAEPYLPNVTVSTRYLAPPLGAGGAGSIIIKVKDNGIGMSEATKAKVFQPFFTTKPAGQGTGLGLSLAYDIVTKGHSGTLEVESTEGVDSQFIISLPFKTNLK